MVKLIMILLVLVGCSTKTIVRKKRPSLSEIYREMDRKKKENKRRLQEYLMKKRPYKNIDKEVWEYIRRFEILYTNPIGPIKIEITKDKIRKGDKKAAMAICFIEEQRIEIDRSQWNSATKPEREIIIFHELAHCELGLHHTEEDPYSECPSSIMHPRIITGQCYLNQLKYYRQELFKRPRNYKWKILKYRQKLGY